MVGDDNVLVEFDYQNVVLVDPNKVVDSEGRAKERLLKHENLVYYANLECNLYPRTRLAVDSVGNVDNRTLSIAKIDYLNPSGKYYLENAYVDDLTGLNSTSETGSVNQIIEKQVNNSNQVYQETRNKVNTDLLLISRIKVETGLSLTPAVTIELQDIRGRALFEQGENSPYSIFFNYPYPLFYLTIKGYLGKAIKYQLTLRTFNASFDAGSGNFIISLSFYAFKYNVLTNLMMQYVEASPYMYKSKYLESNNGEKITYRGYQKMKEVYSEYKSKGLIDANFPEITIRELINRLSLLETYILNTFNDVDISELTNAEKYLNELVNYEKRVYVFSDSWYNTYIDQSDFYITSDGNRLYKLKKEIFENNKVSEALSILKKIIDEENDILSKNEIFGIGKKYSITNDINESDFYFFVSKESDIDWEKTYTVRTGRNDYDSDNFLDFKNINYALFLLNQNKEYVFVFDGKNRFLSKISILQNIATSKLNTIQDDLTNLLKSRLSNDKNGLGFKPTLKNVIAVILANTESFLRMMCDVHEKAWNVRNEKIRIDAILSPDKTASSVDSKDSVSTGNNNLSPVYPWPQYFVEKNEGERFILTYPGDNSVISNTKGYLYDVWPEVEFVEEYLKAKQLTKDDVFNYVVGSTIVNERDGVNRITFNSIDFPNNYSIFRNKQEVKFIYEIWERVFLSSFYQRFGGDLAKNELIGLLSDLESTNIVNSLLGESPFLIQKLKNLNLNSANYIGTLYQISNLGIGESWQKFIRDIFVTDYIESETTSNFRVYDVDEIRSNVNKVNVSINYDKLTSYLKSTATNTPRFLDTYPFVINNWGSGNMSSGIFHNDVRSLYNTAYTYKVNDSTKLICNFDFNTADYIRPMTNFTYINSENPLTVFGTSQNFTSFYGQRVNDVKSQQVTEGVISYINYSGNVSFVQTTSMLNTPYFVNSLVSDIDRWYIDDDQNPYVRSAYLFLNSLPLATLREKYKKESTDFLFNFDTDYIFASIKKFGALHKLPYAWILKYGSIWYRYKKMVNDGVDILDDVWNNFDYTKNFDPVGEDITKTYDLKLSDGTQISYGLETTSNVGATSVTNINVGFYPKLVNNFNIFYRGYELFSGYTNDAINNSLSNTSNGFTLTNVTDSLLNVSSATEIFNLNAWNCTILDSKANLEYIVPSFGSNINQVKNECINDDNTIKIPIKSNPAIYNGSVRSFWALPNYGYFDNSKVNKPSHTKYIKSVNSTSNDQSAFNLNKEELYTTIEEIFSVFDKDILDYMESEFLKFTTSRYNVQIKAIDEQTIVKTKFDALLPSPDNLYLNFQLLMTKLMSIDKLNINKTSSRLQTESISEFQFKNIVSTLRGFLDYEVVLKIGNPGNFNRRLFDSYSNGVFLEDKISFAPYSSGSINPNANPEAFKALKTNVGFSTINGIKYNNDGTGNSYIFDFFSDVNVEFSVESIETLAPLIKIYATQKALDPTYNSIKFRTDITTFINEQSAFNSLLLDQVMTKARTKLPNISGVSDSSKPSELEGEQTKLELWELFKGINDTWIAGYDYTQTTFLEDVLLLDRGNRNISDEAFIDPLKVKNLFTNVNPKASVYVYLETLIRDHNFNVMMHPGYVNYYNVQTVTKNSTPRFENTLEFGNTLFGTFLNVDTRESSPKLVCIYNAVPSQHPDIKGTGDNDFYKFKSDTFGLTRSNNNPILDPLTNKIDWGLSNRVVGFNVDIGIRNQNVFYNFNVSQNLGKATSESIVQETNMIEQANGKFFATQNVSLFEFYKSRSYECSVTSLGNAMIQPSMYFNLKHVPMFNGTYMITSVDHSIVPGKFDTSFKGIRQSMFSYPKEYETYIQTITKRMFSEITSKFKNNTSSANNTPNNDPNKISKIDPTQNCSSSLNSAYSTYTFGNISNSTINVKDLGSIIASNTTNPVSRNLCFVSCYVNTFSTTSNAFVSSNNNYANILLNRSWGSGLSNFFDKTYICGIKNDVSIPLVSFGKLNDLIGFLTSIWNPDFSNLIENNAEGIAIALINKNIYTTDKLSELQKKCQEALDLINSSKIFQ